MPTPHTRRKVITGDGKPTGRGTAGQDDVYDPHPANEEHADRIPRPGGDAQHEDRDIGPNNAVHNGHAGRKPKNAET